MDELRRIVGGTNCKYIEETKGRWADFCAKVQFYGVWKKALKPPFPLDLRGGIVAVPYTKSIVMAAMFKLFHKRPFFCSLLNAFPSLFPSPTPPPKRLGNASEALLHILKVRIVMLGLYYSL